MYDKTKIMDEFMKNTIKINGIKLNEVMEQNNKKRRAKIWIKKKKMIKNNKLLNGNRNNTSNDEMK